MTTDTRTDDSGEPPVPAAPDPVRWVALHLVGDRIKAQDSGEAAEPKPRDRARP